MIKTSEDCCCAPDPPLSEAEEACQERVGASEGPGEARLGEEKPETKIGGEGREMPGGEEPEKDRCRHRSKEETETVVKICR